jgi:3-isopropylmalate/(R)-2-methylmalate dehydratase large subunit
VTEPNSRRHVVEIRDIATETGMALFGVGDPRQGIVHVVGPEQGITLPGLTMVCGDSHTSTHGALGALAFGIGTSEVSQVMATQCLWQRKPLSMRVQVDGELAAGVTAKDLVLAIIAKIGTAGAVGRVIEYTGSAIRGLSIEGRLTLCNMSIEAGARAGMVAPDEKTYAYLQGRPFAPAGEEWDQALAFWRTLPSDDGAVFDRDVQLDGAAILPMMTWGTSPEHASSIDSCVPDPANALDPAAGDSMRRALAYMGLEPGTPLQRVAVDRVFIGSCTNSRIEDLRDAAAVVRAMKGKARIPAMVSPGSSSVKRAAEAEGLDRVFLDAGFEWREAGCSMCVGMNGDLVAAGQRCASTSNRNFAGRQGRDARTHLVSPATAAATAMTGLLADAREYL